VSKFALNTSAAPLPRERGRAHRGIARVYGLDFFPVVFEILKYDQMNEIAAYGGFPSRYPHWRFGMEYEQLSEELRVWPLEDLRDGHQQQPLVRLPARGQQPHRSEARDGHVYGHVDFFKNNFCFRATDLDARGPLVDPIKRPERYDPDRRWIDKMANHGARVSRHVERHGLSKVESSSTSASRSRTSSTRGRPSAAR
jgi:stage V sporulation protein R